jgi:hypothetical protein
MQVCKAPNIISIEKHDTANGLLFLVLNLSTDEVIRNARTRADLRENGDLIGARERQIETVDTAVGRYV